MEHQANPPIASPLDELLIKRPMPSLRVAAWPIMILITVVLTWANFAKLDEVSVAMGKVVPLGKTKVVQHLEGGIVQEIYVSEGDTVVPGDGVVVVEAMKMENELKVSVSGIVTKLFGKPGDLVDAKAPLVEIKPPASE